MKGVERWLQRRERIPFFKLGSMGSPLTLILHPQLVKDGFCRQFESSQLTVLVAPLAVEGGVREVGWAAGMGVLGTGRAMRRSGRVHREEKVFGSVAELGTLLLTYLL